MNRIKHTTFLHASVWIAAIFVGVSAVLYAKVIAWTQNFYFEWFQLHPYFISAVTPVGFLLATFLVRRFAPDAKGSGIPQVLEAIEISKKSTLSR